jgi:hypothetical protein
MAISQLEAGVLVVEVVGADAVAVVVEVGEGDEAGGEGFRWPM